MTGLRVAPLPCRAGSVIQLALGAGSTAAATMFDAAGRRLGDYEVGAGHEVRCPSNLGPGVYWLRVHQLDRSTIAGGKIVIEE